MSKYVFPAILTPEENGYSVRFPDLENCFTCGENLHHALYMATDILNIIVMDMENDKQPIPDATSIDMVDCEDGEIVTLVSCDTIEYRKLWDSKAVKKTVTLPAWLNTYAEKAGLNFSQLLQKAIKQELKIEEY